jgi:hypothetical protein
MEIDKEFVEVLLDPLSCESMLTLSEYVNTLEANGVCLDGPDGRIDNKFDRHLRYLCSKSMIVNPDGSSDLKSLGFVIGAGGNISIVGDRYVMKTETNIQPFPSTIDNLNPSVTYNISGSNARVNNQSVDNSTNIVNENPEISEHILSLRKEIERVVELGNDKSEALEIVDAIEGQFDSSTPSKVVMKTLVSALPHSGAIASIGSFLLAAVGS